MAEKMKATRDGAGDGLIELGKTNKDVVVLTGDLAGSTRTDKFEKLFPEKFLNMGIAEQDMVGTAVGLALAGKIPFVCSFSCFVLSRAHDQIRVTVCYNDANVKIIGTHSGITVGADGATAQSLEDIAIMRVLPNMKVVVPADAAEAKKAVISAAAISGPVFIRVGRGPVPAVTGETDFFEIGKANVFSTGTDVNIIACGIMVKEAIDAAEDLKKKGISSGVVNMHTIKPLDGGAILNAAKKSGAIVTAEEHQKNGGLGGAVAEFLGTHFSVPMEIVAIEDTFGESGESEDLKIKYGLTKEKIIEACMKAIKRKARGL